MRYRSVWIRVFRQESDRNLTKNSWNNKSSLIYAFVSVNKIYIYICLGIWSSFVWHESVGIIRLKMEHLNSRNVFVLLTHFHSSPYSLYTKLTPASFIPSAFSPSSHVRLFFLLLFFSLCLLFSGGGGGRLPLPPPPPPPPGGEEAERKRRNRPGKLSKNSSTFCCSPPLPLSECLASVQRMRVRLVMKVKTTWRQKKAKKNWARKQPMARQRS